MSRPLKLLSHPAALGNMVQRLVIEAGEITLDHFDEAGCGHVDYKADGSPVTLADQLAEAHITQGLEAILPGIPVIGEEAFAAGGAAAAAAAQERLAGANHFWLVDALDGTRAFAAGEEDFTVNVALIEDGEPVMGIVYAPALGELYAGHRELGAVRWLEETDTQKPIKARLLPRAGASVVISRNRDYGVRLDEFLAGVKVAKTIRRGSSLKICLVAAGRADFYPGFGATCEWDTAAGHAILRAAGGDMVDLKGRPLRYGHAARGFINPDFLAGGDRLLLQGLLEEGAGGAD